jgi:hypothetical protein
MARTCAAADGSSGKGDVRPCWVNDPLMACASSGRIYLHINLAPNRASSAAGGDRGLGSRRCRHGLDPAPTTRHIIPGCLRPAPSAASR